MPKAWLTRGLAAALLAGAMAASPAWGQGRAGSSFSDEAVEAAIQSGINYLWSQWDGERYWETGEGGGGQADTTNSGGRTALCAYALLASGVNHQEPRLAKTIAWLGQQKLQGTYSLALRANLWTYLPQETYRRNLDADVRQLCASINTPSGNPNGPNDEIGGYHYVAAGKPDNGFDNSNSQFGVLGAWAGLRNGVEVPLEYWRLVESHWMRVQQADGGWQYSRGANESSTGSMTAGGLASLFVCLDAIYGSRFLTCRGESAAPLPIEEGIQRGLKWFDENYSPSANPGAGGNQWFFYYLYGVERVGLSSGHKYFGAHDWYKEGASSLLGSQGGSGEFSGLVNTAFALLFLSRGRHPVLFNHLEYPGDWNNRPRGLANLTSWISQTFEREVGWQIINLNVPVEEWHDAPILCITGSAAPRFSDEQLARMAQYAWQGGTILSIGEGGGAEFNNAMRQYYAKMFPAYPLKALEPRHPIFTLHLPVKGVYRLSGVSNGVRMLAIHGADDLPRSWQANNRVTGRGDFELAANIYFYVTDRSSLRSRGTTMWPTAGAAPASRKITVARLKHAGVFDPEPLAWTRFNLLMVSQHGIAVEATAPMPIADLDAKANPIAHLTGTTALKLTEPEKAALKAYCLAGGMLILESAGGNADFRQSAEKLLGELFTPEARGPLGLGSDIYALPGMELGRVSYRRASRMRFGSLRDPRLQGVQVGGRLVCVYSPEDLTAGMVGYQAFGVEGYAPDGDPKKDSAFRVMRNIVVWAAAAKRDGSRPETPASGPSTPAAAK